MLNKLWLSLYNLIYNFLAQANVYDFSFKAVEQNQSTHFSPLLFCFCLFLFFFVRLRLKCKEFEKEGCCFVCLLKVVASCET
jgi:glucan phosphoethanolaminetransferase (alkaline phosphatase superfamily)